MGKAEQHLTRLAARAGNRVPDRIANKPVLGPFDDAYLLAFRDLDTERATGFGIGRIPWSAVRLYGESCGLVGDFLEDFVYIILQVDLAYIAFMKKRVDDGKPAKDS